MALARRAGIAPDRGALIACRAFGRMQMEQARERSPASVGLEVGSESFAQLFDERGPPPNTWPASCRSPPSKK